MKHILVLTGRYIPKMSPNGICIDNIIRKLSRDKYSVTCICYDDHEKAQVEGTRIIRVSRGPLKSILYRHEKKNGVASSILVKLVNLIDSLFCIPFLFTWPWNDPIYTEKVFRISKKLYKENPYDYIIAVHMPISSLIVANKMKKIHSSIKVVPYFLDSLSGGRPISLFSEDWNRKKKLKWEERLLPNADKIVVMEASRNHHERFSADKPYYSKFVYLDIPLLCEQKCVNSKNPFNDHNRINVTFTGSALQPMRNIQFFVKLAEEIHRLDKRIVFNVIGQCNCIELFNNGIIRYYEPMSHDQILPYLEYSDVLFNLGVKVPSAISGKIFEYMTYGKPIISTYSIPNEACIPYLKRYPISLLLEESDDNIVEAAKASVDFIIKSIGNKVDFCTLKETYRNNLPETFIEEIFEKDEV